VIIDVHNHVVGGRELPAYQASLINSRGFHGRGRPAISEKTVQMARWNGFNHVELLQQVGTDMALLSPRPYTLMHSEKPDKIVHWFVEATNDATAIAVKLNPDVFQGIAGLPQCAGVSPTNTFDEIDRCINDLGFVGVMVNPDPGEGDGQTPGMGDPYWYPLYEKLTSMDVPVLLHPASCKNGRESFHGHFITEESIAILSIANSTVFDDFPTLKIIVSHGGGSVPYQVGRWRSQLRHGDEETFDEQLKKFYFDTALYNVESLELLFKIVGTDRCLFGTERPGAGAKADPRTGRWYDDVKPLIDSIAWLSEDDRRQIFETNALEVFTRLRVPATAGA
jgi:predicted TIM-barrel fold metal-dependent hydrolase